MANVPGVLIVGDDSVQGGPGGISTQVTSLNVSLLNNSHAGDVMRVTPDDPTTGNPTAGSLGWKPWFDGNAGDSVYSVSSSTASTVKATGTPGWTVNQWAGMTVSVITATSFIGFTDRKTIVSNTADTLTISGTWTSNPTASPLQAFFIGQGRWRDYHPDAGRLTASEIGVAFATRSGSSYMNGGIGIGVDAGLIRELWDHVWPTAPRFQLAKWFSQTPTYSSYDDAFGSVKTAFLAELARYNAAWTLLATGDTLAWELLVLDMSQRDVIDWATNPTHYTSYQAKLQQTIAWFRSVLGNASLKVVTVNHANVINNVAVPSGTSLANTIHRAVAAADTDKLVRCVSMEGAETYLVAPYDPDANRTGYAARVYWSEMARSIRQTYELMSLGAPAAINGAVPVYIIIGDSIFTGGITNTYLTELASPTITIGPRDGRQGIWNRGTQAVEPYDACDNSNTSGTTGAVAGPEASLIIELMNRHPVTGCIIIKRTAIASSLIGNVTPWTGGGAAGGRWSKSYAATEHYGQLVQDAQDCFAYINRILGKQADLVGVYVSLGTNDQAVTGGGALFSAELATFVADLREDFSTRTSGRDLPVYWRRPQLAAATALPNESVKVRAAIASLALADAQFVDVNCDDLERDTTSNVHETPESQITDGQRLAAQLSDVSI